jgi:acetyltransferase-like isoleucine patch superfamily enzyme
MIRQYIKKMAKALLGIKEPAPEIIGKTRIFGNSSVRNSVLGEYTYISPNSLVDAASIGRFCSIGPCVTIGFGDHPTKHISSSPVFYHQGKIFDRTFATAEHFDHHKTVSIGNDVWIGANVYIRNGVTIGDGAVIAAGSVVTKDVPPYAIFGGTPAQLIKFRFGPEIIARLLELKWWDWSDEELQKYHSFFISDVTEELIDQLINRKTKNTP